jgi:hypothetical protein
MAMIAPGTASVFFSEGRHEISVSSNPKLATAKAPRTPRPKWLIGGKERNF